MSVIERVESFDIRITEDWLWDGNQPEEDEIEVGLSEEKFCLCIWRAIKKNMPTTQASVRMSSRIHRVMAWVPHPQLGSVATEELPICKAIADAMDLMRSMPTKWHVEIDPEDRAYQAESWLRGE